MVRNNLNYVATVSVFCCVIQLSLGILVPTTVQGKEAFNHEGHVLGAFSEEVNGSLFYESYIPLVFKLRIPDWKQESLRLNKSLVCQNDDMTSSTLCPVAYHLDRLLSPISLAMRFYRNVFSASSGDFYEHNFSCEKIKPHFLHFSTQLGGLVPYLNEFRNRCPLGKNVSLQSKNLSPNAAQHAVMSFEKMKELHEESIKDQKEESSSASDWKFIEMASFTSLQNSYLLAQYVDSVRWENAFSTCQSYKLDVGMVSPLMLNDSLSELSRSLHENGYTFSLPFLSALPHYYKIPLVDCILTMSNSIFNIGFNINGWMFRPAGDGVNSTANLVVRLLVPVIKMGISHKLIKLNKVPYIKIEKGVEKICEIQNFQPDDVYLVQVNLSTGSELVVAKISPYCLSSKLCKIPEATHRQVVDPCVMGIITQNHDLTSKSCIFDCFPVPNSAMSHELAFPIFTQLASNMYAVTGLAPEMFPLLLLECGGKTTHAFKPNTTEGAILVTLPCNCQLVFGYKRFAVQHPCDDPLDVEHVIEFGVHHHHRTTSADDSDFVDYLVDSLDSKDFNLTYSDKNVTDPDKISTTEKAEAAELSDSEEEKKKSEESFDHQPVYCGHVLVWLFLIFILLLNIFTVFILYKNSIINFNAFLIRGNSNNITRLQNDIPVSTLRSSEM